MSDFVKFDRWPLGVHPFMDTWAAEQGLSHWSCVSPGSNLWWVRRDGKAMEMRLGRGVFEELRKFDVEYPIQEE